MGMAPPALALYGPPMNPADEASERLLDLRCFGVSQCRII